MKNNTTHSGPGRPPNIKDPSRTICNAAAKLIAKNGYDGTSLQDIASMVGMTKAGLYHYFPTKQEIFNEITLTTLDDMRQGVEAAIASRDDIEGKLVGFMTAHASYFDTNRDNYSASFFGRAGDLAGDYTDAQLAKRRAYVQILEDLLRTGTQNGALSVPEIPTFARGILGMLNWLSRWHQVEGTQTAASIAEGYAKAILAGIAVK